MNLAAIRSGPKRAAGVATALFTVGGLLVLWSSYIHFHLWDAVGYRHIPTIGVLFLLQWIAGLVLAVSLVAVRKAWVAVIGAGFALSTLVGFVVSMERGLFGFMDSWSAPFATQAFAIELATIAVLSLAAGLCLVGPPAFETTRR